MMPVLVSLLGALILAFYLAIKVPAEADQQRTVKGAVAAANLISYRQALVRYHGVAPSASGVIPDSSLSFDLGYIRDARWTNVISGNVLYTYTTTTTGLTEMSETLFLYSKGALTVGKAATGNVLFNMHGRATGITLPAAIPVGALVIVGD